jgi:hypothetical protein
VLHDRSYIMARIVLLARNNHNICRTLYVLFLKIFVYIKSVVLLYLFIFYDLYFNEINSYKFTLLLR